MRPTFFALKRLALAVITFSAGGAYAQTTSPSTSVSPYIQSHLPGVEIKSILTVDDGTVAKTGGGQIGLTGIPDGIGIIDGNELTPAEPEFFYMLVNHELNATQGVERDHGNIGAFVSKWKINKTTHEVVEGDDLIKETFEWNELTSEFEAGSFTFDRFCSSDRPEPTALFNAASGLGSEEIIYVNGEETFGGRAFGHVVTGPDAGKTFHLEHLGYAAYENILLSPTEQDKTVAVMLDDATNGEVYVYVGDKQSSGNDVEKAGLVGGDLYAIAIETKPYELDTDLSLTVSGTETVALKLIGTDGDRPVDGADAEARGEDTITPVDSAQMFESLKMGGPEDGAWDTRLGRENFFYFATKGTSSNGLNAPTRIWQLEFDDIADPAQGAELTLLVDGPQNRLGSLDNMDFAMVDGEAKLLIQEDLGGESRLSIIWEYDIATGQLEELASHDPARFFDGGSDFFTTNEESSGIVDLQHVLGAGWFAASIQVHTANRLSDAGALVENGQLVLMNIDGRGSDLIRQPIVSSGDLWDYRVDGVEPGAAWNTAGFEIDASWNVDTSGVATGPAETMLGYGESSGTLATDLVQPESPRAAAYYFRNEFDLADPTAPILFDLYLKVDDGAVVYINGVEVARYNLNLDLTVDNDTFASANESAERDWKQINITGADIPLQETGNVIAISVHQENSGSSDMRLDVELIAWNASPDAGDAPATPVGLVVAGTAETQVDLAWDAQSDAKFFRIERQLEGDVAWEVVEAEYPGSFTTYSDTDVTSGNTYNYRMWAVNIYGRSALSAVATGTTTVSLIPVILEENFETPDSFGAFTSVDVAADDRNWSWLLWDFGSTGAVQGNNFGGSAATEDWLITTSPINFLFHSEETLQYDSQISFGGPAPLVLYSTDYDPAVDTNPNDATWTVINEDTSSNGSLQPVGPFDISAIDNTAYIAFKYQGLGGSGGQSVRWTMDDVLIRGNCGFDFEGGENSDIEADETTPWEVFNFGSEFGWIYDTRADQQGAINNNFGSGVGGVNGTAESDDYLVSPPIFVAGPLTSIDFEYYERFGDTLERPLTVLVTDSYTGDPSTTSWTDITPFGLNGSTDDAWIQVSTQAFTETGSDVRVAFRYQSAGNGGGTTKRIGVDNPCIVTQGPLEGGFGFQRSGGDVTFVPAISGGTPPYTYAWDFGDGNTSEEASPTHTYTEAGTFTAQLVVTDADGTSISDVQTDALTFTQFEVPAPHRVRIASFNVSMNRPTSGALAQALAAGNDPQIQAVAEVIQRANADIVLLNEFDQIYDENGDFDRAATEASIEDFLNNYVAVQQAEGVEPVEYGYYFVSPSNTGVPSGLDFNNDGNIGGGNDAYGFGVFPGQFAMAMISKHRILDQYARTFQFFRWKDMPGALLPPDPNDSDNDGDTSSYYSEEELDVFRLSSKTHWDVPVFISGFGNLHILGSHPTPPVFDDGTATEYPSSTVVDWNGLRNHDEIRFWNDYVTPGKGRYIYDDAQWERAGNRAPKWRNGGLRRGAKYVIMGDQNADPTDGDATFNPISLLLNNPRINTRLTPSSAGALEQVPSGSDRETKTASFNLRADYALPSRRSRMKLKNAWVFWPLSTDLEANLLNASDHRMVVIDIDRY